MTDDEIRLVFPELERIGVALSRPPGLALGTGFRDGEFLTWLRALPNGLGHDAFVARLQAHLDNAQPNAATILPDDPSSAEPRRWWPTQDQLEAGIDLLVREWDPLGARLGRLSRDDVGDFAYDALSVAVSGEPAEETEARISDLIATAEEREFGVRASPLEQRRYLARRLIQVVADHPAPRHEFDTFADNRRSVNIVELGPRGDEPPALDQTALCTECGATGTVAVVMREVAPFVSRYCPTCWATARGRYLVWFSSMDGAIDPTTAEMRIASLDRIYEELRFQITERPRFVASALWEDRLDLVRATLGRQSDEPPADRERTLRWLADGLVKMAPEMYGPMPADIAAFVRQYAPADA